MNPKKCTEKKSTVNNEINELNKYFKKIKITHSCNLPRISFFKRCMKEAVVVVVFKFELNFSSSLSKK